MRSLALSRPARTAALLALLVLGALAPAASAAPQGPWALPATDISTGVTPSASASQVAVGPDGTTTVVWSAVDGSTSAVYARTRPPGGTFGAAVTLSAAGEFAMTPEVATGADGTTVVAWTNEGTPFSVHAAVRKGPAEAFGAPVTLSDASGTRDAQLPRVAVTADGTATVVWFGYDPVAGDYLVQAATGTAAGGFATPVTLDDPPAGEGVAPPRISTGAGQTLVVWVRYTPAGSVVRTATRAPGGSFGAATTVSPADGQAAGASGAIAPDGSATIVYSDVTLTAVETAVTRPPGGAFGAPVAISAAAVLAYGDADVAIAPDGTRTAAWSSYDGTDTIAWAATSAPSGAFPDPAATPPVRLSPAGRSAIGVRVAASLDGTATAVWSEADQPLIASMPRIPLISYSVQSRTRPAGGAFGAPTTLGTVAQPNVTLRNGIRPGLAAAVGVGPNGVATTSWTAGRLIAPLSAQRGAPVAGAVEVASTAWPTLPLTVSRAAGGGTVTSAPAGIDCGATCQAAFPELAEVTLTATPSATSAFAGWGGACAGATPTCKVSMTEARSVTAAFRPGLTVTRQGTGTGAVGSSPDGIRCGTTCIAPFDANAVVTLTAAPAAGSGFTRWTGCAPVQHRPNRCTVTMSDVRAVTATFTRGPIVADVQLGDGVIQQGTRSAGLSFRSSRAGTATVTLTSCRDVACASMAARVVAVQKVAKGRSTIRIPTRRLKVGRYRLAVRVTANRIVSKPATATLTVRPRPHFTG